MSKFVIVEYLMEHDVGSIEFIKKANKYDNEIGDILEALIFEKREHAEEWLGKYKREYSDYDIISLDDVLNSKNIYTPNEDNS